MEGMLEKLIVGLSKTTDQHQFRTMTEHQFRTNDSSKNRLNNYIINLANKSSE